MDGVADLTMPWGHSTQRLMRRIHGADIYDGYSPDFAVDLQGWNSCHGVFNEIIAADRPSIIVDVGVWKGASTIGLATLLRDEGIDGTVIAVDTFLGSAEHWVGNETMTDLIPMRLGRPMLYEQFLSNVVRSGFRDSIVPLPLTSIGAARVLWHVGVRANLIHLDAAHDYDSVLCDARAYWMLLAPGGYLIGDDFHEPTWPGVVRAAREFSEAVGAPIVDMCPKWVMRKPHHI